MTDPELKARAVELMHEITLARERYAGEATGELFDEIDQLIRDMAEALDVRDRTLNMTVAQMTKMAEKQRHDQSS